MKLWIDNTGLHSVGRCLDKRTENRDDVDGLLQLSTLMIFADSLSINGFELDPVASRTRDIRDQIISIAEDESILKIEPKSAQSYALACEAAASRCAAIVADAFQPDEHQIMGGEPDNIPEDIHQAQFKLVELLDRLKDSQPVEVMMAEALERKKAAGAVEHMLACSTDLRTAIRGLVKDKSDWSDLNSYQLNVFLRYYLNDELAVHEFAGYAPAIGRAGAIRRRTSYILQRLQDSLDDVVKRLRGSPTTVPSVAATLLVRGKGEPKGILWEALALRRKSEELRSYLAKLVRQFDETTAEGQSEIHRAINELAKQLEQNLGLREPPRLRDAIELHFVLGIPAPRISGAKLAEWVQYSWANRRIAVLTDISKVSAYSDESDIWYRHLVRECASKAV